VSLYDEFLQTSVGTKQNPNAADGSGDSPVMSQELSFLFWVASKRDASEKDGPRPNPGPTGAGRYWSLEEIEEAGRDMGLEDLDLQAFVNNAATWF